MKKSFKKFLSTVLATVMAVSTLTIGMTSTAMADTPITSSVTYDFTTYASKTLPAGTAGFEGISGDFSAAASDSKTYVQLNKSGVGSLTFTAGKTFNIVVNSTHSNNAKGLNLVASNGTVYNNGNKTGNDLVVEGLAADTYTLKSDGNNHGYISTITITMDNAGGDESTETTTESVVDPDESTETTTEEVTETTTAGVLTGIELVDSLNASDLPIGDITEETVVGKFTLIADSSNKLTVEANDKTANGLSITNRLKTNGSSSTTKRSIKITTAEADTTLYVWAKSGSDTADRPCVIWSADGKQYASETIVGSKENTIPGFSVVLKEVGDYYVGSGNSGMNFYLIGTDKALAGETEEPAVTPSEDGDVVPAVLKDGNDFYVVSVVKAACVDNADYNEVAQITKPSGTEIAKSNVVYNGIKLGDTVYSAKDFGGADDDYIFASVIDGTDVAEDIVAKIQSAIETVLRLV